MLRIEILDEGGFAKQEPDASQVIEVSPKFVVGEDREVSRHQIDVGTRLELRTQKISDSATAVVVANARGAKRLVGHGSQG